MRDGPPMLPLLWFPTVRVPKLDCSVSLVTAAGSHVTAVGAEGYTPEFTAADPEPVKFLARDRVEDLHRLTLARRGQAPAVGAEDDAEDTLTRRGPQQLPAGLHIHERNAHGMGAG